MCNKDDSSILRCDRRSELMKVGTNCKKCEDGKGIVVLRVKDVYCRSCFLSYFIHKFRACLGKAKVMKPGDRVLVAYSGGQSSTALIHLIKQALEEENKKKLKYFPLVLYVDEGALLDQTPQERNDFSNQILNSITWTGFPIYRSTLEMVYEIKDNDLYVEHTEEKYSFPFVPVFEQKLRDLFTSVSTLTAKEDLLGRLRNQLICKIAEKLKSDKIFLADSENLLSIRLLSDIAQGRGAQLKANTGFSHYYGESKIQVLRPMRELLAKEIIVYNKMNKLDSFVLPTIGTKSNPMSSISRLTEQFINEIQEEFPATISTIFRTGDKLDFNPSPISNICILCGNYLDTDVAFLQQNKSELNKFSQSGCCFGETENSKYNRIDSSPNYDLESHTKETTDLQNNCYKGNCACNKNMEELNYHLNKTSLLKDEIIYQVCYGCQVTLTDCKDLNSLPESVKEASKKQIRRNQMKEEISEFLL